MKKTLKIVAIIIVLVLGTFLMAGCGKSNEKKNIIGTWKKGEGEYVFNEDGTAIMNQRMAKYSMQDNNLYIEYEGITKTYKFTVKIDNNKMILTAEDGSTSEYTKNK